MILTLFVGLLCFTYQAKAQWTVIDPSNLVQNIKSAVQSSTTATNMVKSLQESIKIYNQSKAYYDALKSVHNIIKDARKVKLTLEMVSEITEIYTSGFNRMVSDPNFTVDELAAISADYARLLEESNGVLQDLRQVINVSTLSMTDKDRMDVVDRCYYEMRRYRNLVSYYTNKNIAVSYLRARKKNDLDRVMRLYGNETSKYW